MQWPNIVMNGDQDRAAEFQRNCPLIRHSGCATFVLPVNGAVLARYHWRSAIIKMETIINYIKELLIQRGYPNLANNIQLILSCIIATPPILWKYTKHIHKYWQQYKLNKDLHPFYTADEIERVTQCYVPTHFQNVDPSRENEPIQTYDFSAKNELVPLFIEKVFRDRRIFKNKKCYGNDHPIYIILADIGMGKTTFLVNLYLRYINQIVINRRYKIRLLPLGYYKIDEEIQNINIKDRRNTILLLDGFDEDSEAIVSYKGFHLK